MTTPLFPTFEKRISDSVDALIAVQVTPWSFMAAGPLFQVKRSDGREITYQGVTFDGCPQQVFWGGYIEPFLEDLVVRELAFAVESCKDRKVRAQLALPELQGLLLSGCTKVFAQMANIDQRLQGRGDPNSVQLRPVESEVAKMAAFIETRISAELLLCKPRPLEEWYEHNKFWVWIFGFLIPLAALLVTLWLGVRQKPRETPQVTIINNPPDSTSEQKAANSTTSGKNSKH